jgi:adenylate kinase
MRKLLIINGLPGSGKGTQAEKIAEKLGLIHISSGQLIRDALKSENESEFIKQVRERYNAGVVQPDEVALKLIEEKIDTLPEETGVIFDSFPINLSQAKLLESLVDKYHFQHPVFVMLSITSGEAIKRLSTRKVCIDCGAPYIDKENTLTSCQKCGGKLVTRSDDEESVVRKRIENYLPLLNDLSAYYEKQGRLITIDGQKSIDQVFEDILAAL